MSMDKETLETVLQTLIRGWEGRAREIRNEARTWTNIPHDVKLEAAFRLEDCAQQLRSAMRDRQ